MSETPKIDLNKLRAQMRGSKDQSDQQQIAEVEKDIAELERQSMGPSYAERFSALSRKEQEDELARQHEFHPETKERWPSVEVYAQELASEPDITELRLAAARAKLIHLRQTNSVLPTKEKSDDDRGPGIGESPVDRSDPGVPVHSDDGLAAAQATLSELFQRERDHKLEAQIHPDLVAKYSLFKENVHFDAGVVYHPCGATDISPSKAFRGSKVVYADIDDRSMQALRDAGYEAHTADATNFDPGPVDVLILINPAMDAETPTQFVKDNGWILCNDYHGTATSIKDSKLFEHVALISPNKEGLIFDRDKLEDCWKEVETDDEFKNAPFTWGAANYNEVEQLVEAFTGSKENILAGFKNIVEKARQGLLEDAQGVYEDENTLMMTYKGKQFVMDTTLPKKKGVVDDIFVFRKPERKLSNGGSGRTGAF